MAVQPHAEPTETVPLWFHHYAVENERQHAALNQRITEVETRLVRWLIGVGGVVIAAMTALQLLID